MIDPTADKIANYLIRNGPISVRDISTTLHIIPIYVDQAVLYEMVHRLTPRFHQVMMDDGPWLEPKREMISDAATAVSAFKEEARAHLLCQGFAPLKDPEAWKKAREDIFKKLKSFGMKQDMVRHGDSFVAKDLSSKDAEALQTKIAKWWRSDLIPKGFKVSKGHSGALYFAENRSIDVKLTLYVSKDRSRDVTRISVVVS